MKKILIRSAALDQERLFWSNVVMKNVFSVIKKPWVVRFLISNCVAKHIFGRSFCFILLFKKMKESFEKPFELLFSWRQDEKRTHTVKIPAIVIKKIKTVFLEMIGFSWQFWKTETTPIKNLSTKYCQAISDDFFSNAGSLQQSYLNLLFSWKNYFFTQLVFFPVRQLTYFKKQTLLGSVKQLWPEKTLQLVV